MCCPLGAILFKSKTIVLARSPRHPPSYCKRFSRVLNVHSPRLGKSHVSSGRDHGRHGPDPHRWHTRGDGASRGAAALTFLKQIMRHPPLLTIVTAKKLRASRRNSHKPSADRSPRARGGDARGRCCVRDACG